MTVKKNSEAEIDSFLHDWHSGEEQPMKKWFQLFFNTVKAMKDVELQFVSRPGVSYSMRPKHRNQKDRDLCNYSGRFLSRRRNGQERVPFNSSSNGIKNISALFSCCRKIASDASKMVCTVNGTKTA